LAAKELEKEAEGRNFWMCSKKCIIIFTAIIVVGAGVGLGLYFGLRQ